MKLVLAAKSLLLRAINRIMNCFRLPLVAALPFPSIAINADRILVKINTRKLQLVKDKSY